MPGVSAILGRLAGARVSLGQLVELNETLFQKYVGEYSLVVDVVPPKMCKTVGAVPRSRQSGR